MAHRILPEGHPVRKKCDETLAEIKKQIEAADAASEVARPKSSPP
jgi:exonuclease VII small subunit